VLAAVARIGLIPAWAAHELAAHAQLHVTAIQDAVRNLRLTPEFG